MRTIILCHAACTGGSLIFRHLVDAFGLMGISEISHATIPKRDTYLSLDPEAQLFSQGILSSLKFEESFFKRILSCEEIVKNCQKDLLIREHSHRYFFNPLYDIAEFKSVSWIHDSFIKHEKKAPLCIVSIRDPIDSWLGLRASFPNECPPTFDDYCKKYIKFIQAVESTSFIHVIKYEDFVNDHLEVIEKIGKFINQKPSNYQSGNVRAISSGNSGRQSGEINVRPRRPFTTRLVNEICCSYHYGKLCEMLDYPCLGRDDLCEKKINLIKNTIFAKFWSFCYFFSKQCVSLHRYIKKKQIRD